MYRSLNHLYLGSTCLCQYLSLAFLFSLPPFRRRVYTVCAPSSLSSISNHLPVIIIIRSNLLLRPESRCLFFFFFFFFFFFLPLPSAFEIKCQEIFAINYPPLFLRSFVPSGSARLLIAFWSIRRLLICSSFDFQLNVVLVRWQTVRAEWIENLTLYDDIDDRYVARSLPFARRIIELFEFLDLLLYSSDILLDRFSSCVVHTYESRHVRVQVPTQTRHRLYYREARTPPRALILSVMAARYPIRQLRRDILFSFELALLIHGQRLYGKWRWFAIFKVSFSPMAALRTGQLQTRKLRYAERLLFTASLFFFFFFYGRNLLTNRGIMAATRDTAYLKFHL